MRKREHVIAVIVVICDTVRGKDSVNNDHTTVPALDAIRGQRSAYEQHKPRQFQCTDGEI